MGVTTPAYKMDLYIYIYTRQRYSEQERRISYSALRPERTSPSTIMYPRLGKPRKDNPIVISTDSCRKIECYVFEVRSGRKDHSC